MESWRRVWREGYAPQFSISALHALAEGLRTDDKRIGQGFTTTPPPLACVADWPCEAADVIGFAGMVGEHLTRVGEVEEYFARACFNADKLLNEVAACRWFLNWIDDTPRAEMFRELLAEVELALSQRGPRNG